MVKGKGVIMRSAKSSILKKSLSVHNLASWIGGFALLIFALSGLTHPIMTWTGPQAAAFFPPQATIKPELVSRIPSTLQRANITEAMVVKVVPAEEGVLLQVTEDSSRPRRYFKLESGEELPHYEEKYAIWLARYYAGLPNASIRAVKFQEDFSAEYPWVNRLLPVYKVEFDSEDNLSVFVYTELSALADISNRKKRILQKIFQWGHTWSFLDGVPVPRSVLIALMMLSLIGMATSGVVLILLMRNRKMPLYRKFHRGLGFMIWIPILALSSSGLYHLLQNSLGSTERGLKLWRPISVTPERFGGALSVSAQARIASLNSITLNSVTLVEGPLGELLYRLGMPHGDQGKPVDRQVRFNGVPIEKDAIYISVIDGEESAVTDRDIALTYAKRHLDIFPESITNTEIVTRFGPDYDFRNKRLPVWRIDYNRLKSETIFIDPASGFLVDRVGGAQKAEGLSFSILHKWNFLTPLIGRMGRDLVVVLVLMVSIVSTIFGFWLLRLKRSR
jgi:hypothetical protein